jgi:beta-glucosidase
MTKRRVPVPDSLPVVAAISTGGRRDPLFTETDDEAFELAAKLTWPSQFLFGTATASHQVEGGISDSNWTRWEDQKVRADGGPTVKRGERAGRACDVWNRFLDTDLPLAKNLGLTMFRFSIEWSRVEPSQGFFDEKAISRYVSWCVALREAGIEPVVTLYHFTEPGWFCDLGGWEAPRAPEHFGNFVEHVVPQLAPHCSYFCTLNEPSGTVNNGWLLGIHPPGKVGGLFTAMQVLYRMLLAHGRAATAIRRADPGAKVMVANNVILFEAERWWNPVTRMMAFVINTVFNMVVLDVCCFGRPWFPLWLLACACGVRKQLHALRGSVDMIGINHYARVYRKMGLFFLHPATDLKDSHGRVSSGEQHFSALGVIEGGPHETGFEMNDMEWDLAPSSLGKVIRIFWNRYRLPMMVTESGCADEETPDSRRTRYLAGCLAAVNAALADGCDVRGYTYWCVHAPLSFVKKPALE